MKLRPILTVSLVLVGLASWAAAASRKEIVPQARVDVQKYMGPWRVIATTNNKAERNFVDAVETYQLRPDGKIGVHFAWRDKSFDAPIKTHDFTGRIVQDGTNARWKMRLFPLFSASYIIVKTAPDYSYAAVAHPSRKFGWILARQRTIPDSVYVDLLHTFAEQGYDTTQFRRVPQVR